MAFRSCDRSSHRSGTTLDERKHDNFFCLCSHHQRPQLVLLGLTRPVRGALALIKKLSTPAFRLSECFMLLLGGSTELVLLLGGDETTAIGVSSQMRVASASWLNKQKKPPAQGPEAAIAERSRVILDTGHIRRC